MPDSTVTLNRLTGELASDRPRIDLSDLRLRELPATLGLLATIHQLRSGPPLFVAMVDLLPVLIATNDVEAAAADYLDAILLALIELDKELLLWRRYPSASGGLLDTLTALSAACESLDSQSTLTETAGPLQDSIDETLQQLALGNSGADALSSVPLRNLRKFLRSHVLRSFETTLRAYARRVRSIRTLDVSGNHLSDLPEWIAHMSKLTFIDASRNSLSRVPPVLHKLKSLRELDLSGNRISIHSFESDLPTAIRKLELSENAIGGAIRIGARHGALTDLSLYGNEIDHLTIASTLNIRTLEASDNALSRFTIKAGSLPHIATMNLRHNSFTAVPPALSNLSTLKTLNLSENQLRDVGKLFGGTLRLHELDLSDNSLASLPDTLVSQTELRVLDVASNELTHLPVAMAYLPRLRTIQLDRNPLPNFVLEAAQSAATLQQYLRGLEQGTVSCRSAKLLLVGEGSVGKTSLVAAMQDEPFVSGRPTTHGIERRTIAGATSVGSAVTLNTWDFGGQDVYRVSHPFYFTAHALYAIVWRPREGHEQGGVQYWLDRVHFRVGDDAKVVLISTYAGEGRRSTLNLEALEYKFYPAIRGYFAIDNSTREGIASLRSTLFELVPDLPQWESPVPESWVNLLERLQQRPAPFAFFHEVVAEAESLGMTEEGAASAMALYHQVGELLFFREESALASVVITDAEILARAVSVLLEDTVTEQRGGLISHQRIAHLWANGPVDVATHPALHPFLLRLMEHV